jgi:hypothetical protein
VAGGLKLCRVLMLRHMRTPRRPRDQLGAKLARVVRSFAPDVTAQIGSEIASFGDSPVTSSSVPFRMPSRLYRPDLFQGSRFISVANFKCDAIARSGYLTDHR